MGESVREMDSSFCFVVVRDDFAFAQAKEIERVLFIGRARQFFLTCSF